MIFDPKKHRRRLIRLKGYDYSGAGAYFVTICTHNKKCWFGNVVAGNLEYTAIERFAKKILVKVAGDNEFMRLDSYVIMPNHAHMILFIGDEVNEKGVSQPEADPSRLAGAERNAPTGIKKINNSRGVIYNAQNIHVPNNKDYYSSISPKENSLSLVVRSYKAQVTRCCRKNGYDFFAWQSNYYEHVIRNEEDLNLTREYVVNNPLRWEMDKENPHILNKSP